MKGDRGGKGKGGKGGGKGGMKGRSQTSGSLDDRYYTGGENSRMQIDEFQIENTELEAIGRNVLVDTAAGRKSGRQSQGSNSNYGTKLTPEQQRRKMVDEMRQEQRHDLKTTGTGVEYEMECYGDVDNIRKSNTPDTQQKRPSNSPRPGVLVGKSPKGNRHSRSLDSMTMPESTRNSLTVPKVDSKTWVPVQDDIINISRQNSSRQHSGRGSRETTPPTYANRQVKVDRDEHDVDEEATLYAKRNSRGGGPARKSVPPGRTSMQRKDAVGMGAKFDLDD